MATIWPISIKALSFFFFILASLLLLHSSAVVDAENPRVYVDWVVSSAPLSLFGKEKEVILINGQFPGPLLNTTTNDNVYVTVHNHLSEPFLLTWNGVQMRRNSWNDGVQGTNCPIPPGRSWTYAFQMKDQIGSYFYMPSLGFHKAAGGYGPIRINNRIVISVPFDAPKGDFDVLIGDWYNGDYKELRESLKDGDKLSSPDGVLINGKPSYQTKFTFQPGETYRLRISNVGLKASLSFQIQGHKLLLVETEGCYTAQEYYDSLDVHVGQSYSVLVTADQPANATYYMTASSCFYDKPAVYGVGLVEYVGSDGNPPGMLSHGPPPHGYNHSMQQATSIRTNLTTGAARPNPQGSYHYAEVNISRTIILENNAGLIDGLTRYTVNGAAFQYPDTPLKLADYFHIANVFTINSTLDVPNGQPPSSSTPVIDAVHREAVRIVFQNTQPDIQSWHIDGYNFFVLGMGEGKWNESENVTSTYNMHDAIYRSTVQVYPRSWTIVQVALDNQGMWNIRSQDEEKRYLGQEVYLRVRGPNPSLLPDPRDEEPIPANVLTCGKAPKTLPPAPETQPPLPQTPSPPKVDLSPPVFSGTQNSAPVPCSIMILLASCVIVFLR